MIVAAQDADFVRSLAAGIAQDADTDGMWRTALSPTGALPATHFVSAGLIRQSFADIVGNAQATYAAAGGQIPLAVIQALYARSTISDGDGLAVIAQQGLRLIQGDA